MLRVKALQSSTWALHSVQGRRYSPTHISVTRYLAWGTGSTSPGSTACSLSCLLGQISFAWGWNSRSKVVAAVDCSPAVGAAGSARPPLHSSCSPPDRPAHCEWEDTNWNCLNVDGFPRWHRGKVSTCQHRRGRFDSWVGKISWSQKWQPAAVFLPGKSHGQRSLSN